MTYNVKIPDPCFLGPKSDKNVAVHISVLYNYVL
jgi:hypothetical protein